ncbi:MAG TPA: 3-deoxy-D-manno-octulosonic acid transferase [Caulobacteraceae bacterium]|nr:3-deoxy-D-manno-octulosonic acid transferase [Caulobacteraceae bacterium]
MARPTTLKLYGLAMGAIAPLAPVVLAARARRGKEDAARLGERLGRTSVARPDGPLVWLHAVSVGESVSVLPLVERIRTARPSVAILVTSGTRTAAELLGQRLPPGAIHQYTPIDSPGAVGRFLDHWRPDAGLFVESELWPNLILAARERGVRLALISARMTEASADGWRRAPAAARAVLGAFELALPQDAETEARLAELGGHVVGRLNLKRHGAALDVDPGEVAALRAAIGERSVVLGASTHPGEEALIASCPLPGRPLTIIAPRHPDRGDEIAAQLSLWRFAVARRSRGERPSPSVDIYLADQLGEMGLLYLVADVVVMGGGFVETVGGHNPLEAARLGRAVISGPHVANHAEVYAEMVAVGAATIVQDPAELARAVAALLMQPGLARAMGERASAFAAVQGEAFEAGWRALVPLLPA